VQKRDAESSWLGAEALPSDLAEINRVYLATQGAAVQVQGSALASRPRKWAAAAMRWLKRPFASRS
jgi:hypothetical protein